MTTHHVYPERRLIIVRFSHAAECRGLAAEILRDPAFGMADNMVIVAPAAGEGIGWATTLAKELTPIWSAHPGQYRCAIVIDNSAARQSFEMAATKVRTGGLVVKSFVSEGAALAWAGWSTSNAADVEGSRPSVRSSPATYRH